MTTGRGATVLAACGCDQTSHWGANGRRVVGGLGQPRARASPVGGYPGNDDERINAMWPAFEAALKASGARYEMHMYPGTQHGFHDNSTPRYHEASAKLARERTIAFFKKHLA